MCFEVVKCLIVNEKLCEFLVKVYSYFIYICFFVICKVVVWIIIICDFFCFVDVNIGIVIICFVVFVIFCYCKEKKYENWFVEWYCICKLIKNVLV